MTSSSLNTPELETEILLFNDVKKIEFRYRVHKKYTTDKEGLYFAFPVAVSTPEFAYATQQGWVDPSRDLMKGASLEWFNIQYWMAAHDPHVAVGIVPIDTPLASFGDINRGTWPGVFRPKSGTLFSYAMNNYWHTNYRAGQGGVFTFRYALTSAASVDGGAFTRLGMDELRPAEVDHVVGQDKVGDPPRPLPASGEGFLDATGGDVALITWKKAENGNGTILRLAETGGKAADTTLHFPHTQLASAHLCTGMEDDKASLPVTSNSIHLSFHPFEVLTVRVAGK
jgi:alpha-mannosidase